MAGFLLDRGARVDIRDRLGYTALALAVKEGRAQIVRELIESGADTQLAANDQIDPLMLAAGRGETEIMDTLLKNGARVDTRTAKDNRTALSFAVRNGHLDAARRLLEHGASPYLSARDMENATRPMKKLLQEFKSTRRWIKSFW